MSRSEFLQLTPDEFNAVYEQWNQLQTARYRASWEQARFVAHCSLMPHSRKGLRSTDLVRFDWDAPSVAEAHPATRKDFQRMIEQFEDSI